MFRQGERLQCFAVRPRQHPFQEAFIVDGDLREETFAGFLERPDGVFTLQRRAAGFVDDGAQPCGLRHAACFHGLEGHAFPPVGPSRSAGNIEPFVDVEESRPENGRITGTGTEQGVVHGRLDFLVPVGKTGFRLHAGEIRKPFQQARSVLRLAHDIFLFRVGRRFG